MYNSIVIHDVQNVIREEKTAGTARCLSREELLFDYMKNVVNGCEVQSEGQSWTYGLDGSVRC